MPNPTPARRAAAYLVDPFVPTRDTLPCAHCGTTLSNCDWFSDHLGRLSPRCPNAHRHGTGWRAHPPAKPLPPAMEDTSRFASPVVGVRTCEYDGCDAEIPVRAGGRRRRWCQTHATVMQHEAHKRYRDRNVEALRERAKRTRVRTKNGAERRGLRYMSELREGA